MHRSGGAESQGLLIITVRLKLPFEMTVLISNHSFVPYLTLGGLVVDPY